MGFSATAVGQGIQAGAAYKTTNARKSALDAQGRIDLNNAQIAEWQARQAETVGAQQEQTSQLRTAQAISTQRAEMGANGVDLGSGSATDVLSSSKVVGNIDALTIRDNASRAAWGYRQQGLNFTNDASMSFASADAVNPTLAAAGSLLGSASSVQPSWLSTKNSQTTWPSWMSRSTITAGSNSPRGGR